MLRSRDDRGVWDLCTIAAIARSLYGTSAVVPAKVTEGMKAADPKTTAGRAFVRSLNILLKFARLYGYEHARTIEHLDIAWRELRTAIPAGTEGGLLLGATGNQLLLDGVPLEGAPAEKQFAQLLSAAGLASVQFFPSITEEELGRFARAFPTGKAKPAELAEQLKVALVGAQGIRINEICFVATDSRFRDASMAAQLAVSTLGDDQDQFKQWLNDPQKLLEMIAAAQGASNSGGSAGGPGGMGNGSGRGNGASGESGESTSERRAGGGGPFYGNAVSEGGGTDPAVVGGGAFVSGPGFTLSVPGLTSSGIPRFLVLDPGDLQTKVLDGLFPASLAKKKSYGILSALTTIGQVGAGGGGGMAAAGAFHEQMSQLPGPRAEYAESSSCRTGGARPRRQAGPIHARASSPSTWQFVSRWNVTRKAKSRLTRSGRCSTA